MTLRTLAERFWEKVDKDDPQSDCWLWTAALFGNTGYGAIGVHGKLIGAHRVAWELANGPIPDGRWVLHRCDVRPCVNPAHLFLGDNSDNINDWNRKREQRGEPGTRARLSPEDVREIRRRAALGEPQVRIAERFGVDRCTVGDIRKGRSWAWLAS